MHEKLIRRLFDLGWSAFKSLDKALANPALLEKQIEQYATFHGLSNLLDIEKHIHTPRVCSLPDVMPLGASVCKWPDVHITWDIVTEINGLTRPQAEKGITEAFNRWQAVCGIKPKYTPGNKSARILVGSRKIDGPMGVLAESELPWNPRQCRQWYDAEAWALFDGPSSTFIDFIRVATHELGHALGMNHIGPGNLLSPIYSQTIYTPQAGDIVEMQARYGLPTKIEDSNAY